MVEDVVIEPMTKEFICGPLSRNSIDWWQMPWGHFHARNIPLLRKLTEVYGTCAIIARDGENVIGQLRFYPKAVCGMERAGWLCLQQDYPAGPGEDLVDSNFPALAKTEDKTLVVHCLMTGSPHEQEHPYRRKGIGTRMVKTQPNHYAVSYRCYGAEAYIGLIDVYQKQHNLEHVVKIKKELKNLIGKLGETAKDEIESEENGWVKCYKKYYE